MHSFTRAVIPYLRGFVPKNTFQSSTESVPFFFSRYFYIWHHVIEGSCCFQETSTWFGWDNYFAPNSIILSLITQCFPSNALQQRRPQCFVTRPDIFLPLFRSSISSHLREFARSVLSRLFFSLFPLSMKFFPCQLCGLEAKAFLIYVLRSPPSPNDRTVTVTLRRILRCVKTSWRS